ncbi:sugar ABC transporter ATP-binding protein [Aliihoeflea sp. PC F10.4]
MTEFVLQISGIRKAYGPVRVLEDVGLTLRPGEVRCLAGENGSGKSTLIKIFSGVVTADKGTVKIADREMANDPAAAIDAGLSVIYQDFSLFPNLSVAENIAFLRNVARGDRWHRRGSNRKLATETLARMGIDIDPALPVEHLPVSSKQLIAIARALANDARIIVMDEPTTALTRSEVRRLQHIIEALKKEGVAFLFVSHKTEEIFAFCDTITVLRDGRVVAEGPVDEFDAARLGRDMTGRDVETHRIAREAASPAAPIVATHGLTRHGAYLDVDLTIFQGEIVALVGLLGSGRTELALSLFGQISPDRGGIEFKGIERRFREPMEAMDAGIAYVPEDRLTEGLFLDQPIGDNIAIASLRKSGFVDRRAMLERAKAAVKRLRIKTPGIEPPVATLSGGNQQRVVLARWMERSPELMILNGPTVGVDIGSKREIHEILLQLRGSGTAILVVTDDITEALALADRVLVMVRGRITGEFGADDIDEEKLSLAVTEEGPAR